MKRVLLIILSHLLLFFIVFAYQAQAHADGVETTLPASDIRENEERYSQVL